MVVLAALLGGAAPARADDQPGNQGPVFAVVDDGVGVGAAAGPGSTGGAGEGSTGPHRVCTLEPDISNHSNGTPTWELDNPHPGETGAWYLLTCDDGLVDMVWLSAATGAAARPAGRELAERAWQFLPLPAPAVQFNPSPQAVVNLPTWLWADPRSTRTRSVRAAISSFAVVVQATAVRTVWTFADGSPTLTCAEPTRVYVSGRDEDATSPCSHVFRRSSAHQPGHAFRATATTIWQLRWSASDGTSGTLASVRRTSTFTLAVREVQTVVVRSR